MFEYEGVLHCEVHDHGESPDEIMNDRLSKPFFTERMKMLSRPDGFMLNSKILMDFFPTSDLL